MQNGVSGDAREQLVNLDTAPSFAMVLGSPDLTISTQFQYYFKVYAYPSDGGDVVGSTGDATFGYTFDAYVFLAACGAPPSPITLTTSAPGALSIEFGIPASPYGKASASAASAAWHQEISTMTAEVSTTADFSWVNATVTVPALSPKPGPM